MKRIAYAEEWLTTDDRVADLVLQYAKALGRHETADTVSIPVVDDDGTTRHAQFLIGPASQIIVVDAVSEATSVPGAAEAAAELEARLDRLQPRPVPFDEGTDEAMGLSDY